MVDERRTFFGEGRVGDGERSSGLSKFNVGAAIRRTGFLSPRYRVTAFEFELVDGELVPGISSPLEPYVKYSDI